MAARKKEKRNWFGDLLLGLVLVAVTIAAYQTAWHAG